MVSSLAYRGGVSFYEIDRQTKESGKLSCLVVVVSNMARRGMKQSKVKHIRKEGARFHVVSYHQRNGKAIRECSEKDCEINQTNT